MSQSEDQNVKSVVWISTDLIDLPDWDLRYVRDNAWEQYFTERIKHQGINQPLHVLRKNGRYVLLGGRTRFKAAVANGIRKVPCIVHEKLDVPPELFAFRLDMLKKELGVVSVAWMANKMRFEWGWSIPRIAEELGVTRQHVYRLLKLVERDPKELREIELGLRPAWGEASRKRQVSHHVTHEGKKASSGVRCPICGAFPKKGQGKWIYFCSEHREEYEAVMSYIMREGWREEKRKSKPIKEIRFVDE